MRTLTGEADSTLRVLWDARSIAVIGATDRADSLGRLPVGFLRHYGYDGRIVPVNPKGGTVCGLPAEAELTTHVDLALIMVPAHSVDSVVRRCGDVGVPVAVVMSSGFAETGPDGAALQHQLAETARQAGVRVIGPNCIGTVGFDHGQVATFSPLFAAPDVPRVPGRLGFATQSGALGYGAVSLALERGLGLYAAVNTGNEADVTAVDVLEALAAEPGVDALLGYVETLTDGAALRSLAASGKPVAVLKAGRSEAGSRAAASHTGALAGSDRVVDAALRQLGIARARDVDDLLDIGVAFTCPQRLAGARAAVVTTSGGSGILAADALDDSALVSNGLEPAELAPATTDALAQIIPAFGSTANPVDVTAKVMSDPSLLRRALDVIADDDGVDAVVACFCVLTGDQVDDIVDAVAGAATRTGKPVFVARTGADLLAPTAGARLREAGVPAYPTPARAVRALAGLWQATRPRAVAAPATPTAAPPPDNATEPELKAVLAAAGLPVPSGRLVHDAAAAAAAVADVGGLAVAKAVVPGLVHKSDAGAVILSVTPDSAADAYARLSRLGGPVLIEQMVRAEHGVEMLVGVAASPLGSVLTVAMGGVLSEAVDDAAFRLLPITHDDAHEMIGELRGSRLLSGFRGRPPLDTAALVEILLGVSALTSGWPVGFELDLNPVLVMVDGVSILDAAYVGKKV